MRRQRFGGSGSAAAVRGAAVGAVVGSGGHASLVAVQQPQLGGSGSSTRSHGGWVRQRVAVVAVRQPQHGVQNPYGRPERVIKAFRSPVLIKRMNQTHHRGSPRAQNRHFCALLPSKLHIFWLFEHKIEVFVSECAIFPRFWAVLTQNRHFCTLLGYGTPVLGHFEHNFGLFVLEKRGRSHQ